MKLIILTLEKELVYIHLQKDVPQALVQLKTKTYRLCSISFLSSISEIILSLMMV